MSLGKLYNKKDISQQHWYREGMEMPFMHWTPSISPSTLTWYTGDKLAPWRGHLFVGALNGQTLQRVAFDQPRRRPSGGIRCSCRSADAGGTSCKGLTAISTGLTEKRTLGTTDPNDATSGVVYRINPPTEVRNISLGPKECLMRQISALMLLAAAIGMVAPLGVAGRVEPVQAQTQAPPSEGFRIIGNIYWVGGEYGSY